MCDTCGCNVTPSNEHLIRGDGQLAKTQDGRSAITVLENLLAANDHQATHNREHFDAHGVLAVNLMSSPGAGKTSLLEATIQALDSEYSIAVVEGDLETENDAERIRAQGVVAIQIATGSACHLDAHMVHDALHQLDLEGMDILFIENVGNLVCPASFDLGQHRNVTLLSVPEGDDKPAKYPVMFRAADAVLLTKCDLLPYLTDFSAERAEHHFRHLASEAPFVRTATRGDLDIEPWLDWLRGQVESLRERRRHGETLRPTLDPKSADLHLHNNSSPHAHSQDRDRALGDEPVHRSHHHHGP